jgi:hypothetical protein
MPELNLSIDIEVVVHLDANESMSVRFLLFLTLIFNYRA